MNYARNCVGVGYGNLYGVDNGTSDGHGDGPFGNTFGGGFGIEYVPTCVSGDRPQKLPFYRYGFGYDNYSFLFLCVCSDTFAGGHAITNMLAFFN